MFCFSWSATIYDALFEASIKPIILYNFTKEEKNLFREADKSDISNVDFSCNPKFMKEINKRRHIPW